MVVTACGPGCRAPDAVDAPVPLVLVADEATPPAVPEHDAPAVAATVPPATDRPGRSDADRLRVSDIGGGLECITIVKDTRPVTRASGPLRLAIEVIDGATGARIDARIRAPGSDGTESAETSLPTDADGNAKASVSVVPPAGYGALDPYVWKGKVAVQARQIRVLVPVWPERPITLRVVDDAGRPVVGARADHLKTDLSGNGNRLGVTHGDDRSGDDGILRLTGVPAIPFTKLRFDVARRTERDGDEELGATVEEIRLGEPAPPTPIQIVLMRRPAFRTVGSFGTGSATGIRRRPDRSDERAPLVVRAVRRDGTPAEGVRIRVGDSKGTTGSDGTWRIDDAEAGARLVVAFAHGFLPAVLPVTVGRDAEIVVREPEPRTMRVTVVDESGRPLPAVCVTAECRSIAAPAGEAVWIGESVAQLTGDVELATPRTARDGTVALAVPRGVIRYGAQLGWVTDSAETDADSVRIVLRAPKD